MVESLRRQLASVRTMFLSHIYIIMLLIEGGGQEKAPRLLKPSTFPNAVVVGDLEAIGREKIYGGVGGAAHLSRQETTFADRWSGRRAPRRPLCSGK